MNLEMVLVISCLRCSIKGQLAYKQVFLVWCALWGEKRRKARVTSLVLGGWVRGLPMFLSTSFFMTSTSGYIRSGVPCSSRKFMCCVVVLFLLLLGLTNTHPHQVQGTLQLKIMGR